MHVDMATRSEQERRTIPPSLALQMIAGEIEEDYPYAAHILRRIAREERSGVDRRRPRSVADDYRPGCQTTPEGGAMAT